MCRQIMTSVFVYFDYLDEYSEVGKLGGKIKSCFTSAYNHYTLNIGIFAFFNGMLAESRYFKLLTYYIQYVVF